MANQSLRYCRSGSEAGNENRQKMGYGFKKDEGGNLKLESPLPSVHKETRYRQNSGRCSGHRMYSPTLGRWLSRDPINEDGFRSYYIAATSQRADVFEQFIYQFVQNRSIDLVDYLGLVTTLPNGCDCALTTR